MSEREREREVNQTKIQPDPCRKIVLSLAWLAGISSFAKMFSIKMTDEPEKVLCRPEKEKEKEEEKEKEMFVCEYWTVSYFSLLTSCYIQGLTTRPQCFKVWGILLTKFRSK